VLSSLLPSFVPRSQALADFRSAFLTADDEKKEELSSSIEEATGKLDRIQTEQVEDGRGIAKSQKVVERYISKRQTLTDRKDECTKLIRDLGVLPEEAFTKYEDVDSARVSPRSSSLSSLRRVKHSLIVLSSVLLPQLLKRLHKVKTSLSKYAHVNKQAIQMYEQNDKLRDNIFGRHAEMERSSESIQKLIASLDKQKEEVIEKIFTQVSGFFSEIFEKLVPAGRGRLIMIKKSAAQVSSNDERVLAFGKHLS